MCSLSYTHLFHWAFALTMLSVLSTQYTAIKTKDGELKFLSGGEDSDAEVPETTGYVPFGSWHSLTGCIPILAH